MPSLEPASGVSVPAVPWHDVDELLHEIAALAKSPVATSEFADTVCREIERGLAAKSVAILIREGRADWRLVACSPAEDRVRSANITAAKFVIGVDREGAVEIEPGSAAVPAGVAEAVAELVGDFYRSQRIGELHEDDQRWRQFAALAARLHQDLDLDTTAYRIANDGRQWLSCDRLSLLVVQSGRPKLLAISGVDRAEPRSVLIQTLEQLAAAVASQREPLWYSEGTEALAPELDEKLHAFLNQSPARSLAVIPLGANRGKAESDGENPPIAALLFVECFSRVADNRQLADRLNLLVPQAATAIVNARRHQKVPLARWFDNPNRLDRHWLLSRVGILSLVIAAASLALVYIPTEFTVEARGELQPTLCREIYAPSNGTIADVSIEHGKEVAKGEQLLRLQNSELDLEMARVDGELQTATTKLASIQALKLNPDRDRDNPPQRAHQLTAEEEELKELIRGLETQKLILTSQQAELLVSSPLAGKVLTWNVEPLLAARPVARGQHLLTVADTHGAWQLEMRVPDDRIGYVLAAQQEHGKELPVEFVLATNPGHVMTSKVDHVAQSAEIDDRGISGVRTTAPLTSGQLSDPRPGAEVIARISCGQRSIGYVWFHDLFDAVRSWLFY